MVNTPMKDRTGGGWKRLLRGLLAGTLAVATLAGTITSAAYADPIGGGSQDTTTQSEQDATRTATDPTMQAGGGSSGSGSSGLLVQAGGAYSDDPDARGNRPGVDPNQPMPTAGEQGNRPGSGGTSSDVMQFWQYKDTKLEKPNDKYSGSWGAATDYNSIVRAMAAAGVKPLNDGLYDGPSKAKAALADANAKCVAGFRKRHPGEGNGDCRVVAVGAVAGPGTTTWNGTGITGNTAIWYSNWDKYVAPHKWSYTGTRVYTTATAFDDDKSMSVDKLMKQGVSADSTIVVIVLDKYQPAPQKYKLTVSTKASGRFGTSGGTNPVTDTITLNNSANSKEKVTGQITLTAITLDGTTHVSPLKRFTTSVASTVNVKFSPGDVVKSWKTWPAGEYWFDVAIPKQQHMEAEARHNGRNDKNESWKAAYKLTITTKASGHTLTGGNKPVSDTITLSNNGMASQTVKGTITLNVNTTSGTLKKAKAFTGKTDGSTKVSFKPADVHKDWATWPIGSYWYDVTIPGKGSAWGCGCFDHGAGTSGMSRARISSHATRRDLSRDIA